jgi:ABC-2 type transport system permease protein
MAVYEHNYRPYLGPLTPAWSRFLILPRDAYRSIFQSKLFVAFFALCFVYPLIAAILIYLRHNASALAVLKVDVSELLIINASFFETFVIVQGTLAYFMNLLTGPPLVSRDLANNALPLYLCRPFSRAEYVLGKMSIALILLSLITWVPGLALFSFEAYLEGWKWFANNYWIAWSIFFGSAIWILLLALLSLAISAWVKWRVAASAALLGLFFIPPAISEIINNLFVTRLGSLLNLSRVIGMVWADLFGNFSRQTPRIERFANGRVPTRVDLMEPPLWANVFVLLLLCAFCLLLLVRKIKAYEVAREK